MISEPARGLTRDFWAVFEEKISNAKIANGLEQQIPFGNDNKKSKNKSKQGH
jgi:hypothetical protein